MREGGEGGDLATEWTALSNNVCGILHGVVDPSRFDDLAVRSSPAAVR
ncbi:hypothetical protein [Streptomyces sp. enrichment culture]